MGNTKPTPASTVALGGMMAALALVIMCLGGLIPAATFVCPMAALLLLSFVLERCGRRIAWAWYAAVAVLSLLLGPDKEAAAVFLFLGYYPILKPKMDSLPLKWLWKLLFFNGAILVMYWVLLHLLGLAELVEEFREMGQAVALIALLLGNLTFVMLDRLLFLGLFRRRRHG